MTKLAILKIIRHIVNAADDGAETPHTAKYYGILWEIKQILIKANINEN